MSLPNSEKWGKVIQWASFIYLLVKLCVKVHTRFTKLCMMMKNAKSAINYQARSWHSFAA